jgi:hypothetical protein
MAIDVWIAGLLEILSMLFFFLCNCFLYQLIVADQVGDLGYASELGNYAEYSGAPNEDEVLQYARVVIDVRTFSIHSFAVILLIF